MNKKRLYGLLTLLFVIVSIVILTIVDRTNNVNLSLAIQIILILYLIKLNYGCLLYIKKIYRDNKYSYATIMNLGFSIFLSLNIIRQINLLIVDWNLTTIKDIYLNTLNSFSYFSHLTMPLIIGISIFGVITNIILIKREGFRMRNLLGVIFCIMALLAVFGGNIIYYFTNRLNLSVNNRYIKYFVDILLSATVSYFYCIILATLYCNYMAGRHEPSYDKDYVIILGCKLKKDGSLTPLLKARVDRAILFAKKQKEKTNKDIIYIPSGGKGSDEVIAEAEAIKKYLLTQGVKTKNIIIEDKSVNTKENMRFSKNKIDKKGTGNVIFSTTNYHVFRSGVIASNEGLDCEGIGSKTKWYFYTNALIREFVANLFSQKWRHLFVLITIYITTLILILLGYYNNILILV
ncbi:MAG: YdcF family protein [Bacilli bacterium]|nr:YdcF family protein [Bacilli bacterium]